MEHVIAYDRNLAPSPHQEPKTIRQLLQQTEVSTICSVYNTIISVEVTDEVSKAFKLLIEHKILSVPVYDSFNRKYIGFLDMLDLIAHAFDKIDFSQCTELDQVLKSDVFTKSKCSEVFSRSGRNPFYAIDIHSPVLMAMEFMSKKLVHRVPVFDPSGSLVTIVTQSNIIKLLFDNLDRFNYASLKLQDLDLGTKNVISINQQKKAIEAFKLIHSNKISGVAVVDDNGYLVGNISASDLGKIGYDAAYLSRLFLSCKDFLTFTGQSEEEQTIPGPRCVFLSATLEELLHKFAVTHSHHLYVIDSETKPIGVISLVDVIALFVNQISA